MIALLNDLSNFIGIGTVEIEMPRRAAPGMDAPDGWFWLEPPYAKPRKDTIEFFLHALSVLHCVRCTYRMVSDSTARARVYLLPADVGRGLISRKSKNLRQYMRAVFGAVDVSPRSWLSKKVECQTPLLPEVSDESPFRCFIYSTRSSRRNRIRKSCGRRMTGSCCKRCWIPKPAFGG